MRKALKIISFLIVLFIASLLIGVFGQNTIIIKEGKILKNSNRIVGENLPPGYDNLLLWLQFDNTNRIQYTEYLGDEYINEWRDKAQTANLYPATQSNVLLMPEKTDTGAYFDGINDNLEFNNILKAIGTDSQGSLIFWVNIFNKDATIRRFVNFGDENGRSFFTTFIDPVDRLGFAIGNSALELINLRVNGFTFTENTWYCIAIVQDGAEVVVYIDKQQVNLNYLVGRDKGAWFGDAVGLDVANLGCLNYNNLGNISFLNGSLDQVKYINRPITKNQMNYIYNNFKPFGE